MNDQGSRTNEAWLELETFLWALNSRGPGNPVGFQPIFLNRGH